MRVVVAVWLVTLLLIGSLSAWWQSVPQQSVGSTSCALTGYACLINADGSYIVNADGAKIVAKLP